MMKAAFTYTQKALEQDLRGKAQRFIVDYVNKKNPSELQGFPPYAQNLSVDVIVRRSLPAPRFLTIDVEVNNYIKDHAKPGETCPENFKPEIFEWPLVDHNGKQLFHHMIKPKHYELLPSIKRLEL
jgi:hypothetical protein